MRLPSGDGCGLMNAEVSISAAGGKITRYMADEVSVICCYAGKSAKAGAPRVRRGDHTFAVDAA